MAKAKATVAGVKVFVVIPETGDGKPQVFFSKAAAKKAAEYAGEWGHAVPVYQATVKG